MFSAPIVAFFLGVGICLLHVQLKIPSSVSKFISLYLLFSIGFKGGIALLNTPWQISSLFTVLAGLMMAIVIPIFVFFGIKKKLTIPTASAVAASYGSVSVITFITATSYLEDRQISYGGQMVALMVLMEFPAILISLLLAKFYSLVKEQSRYRHSLEDVFKNESIFLLLGGFLIGLLSKPSDHVSLQLFFVDLQKGMLVFFLLDMGLLVGKNIKNLKKLGPLMLGLGILIPSLNAACGLLLVHWLGIPKGDAFLLVVLVASASYIAVPAAFRLVLPQAETSVYLTLALGITFPFNMLIGLPIYAYFCGI